MKNNMNDTEIVEEELAKGPNYWKDRDPVKYRKMLARLKRERKTPGHKERATQQVLQAKRRENGGPGTTAGQNGKSGHSSDHMTTKTGTAVKNYQNSEKKAGTKLSIDRKDNSKGYDSSNVRNVPQKLNIGRHSVDSEKLNSWKKRLKKSGVDEDSFITMLCTKALDTEDEQLANILHLASFENILKALELKE